jgi:putative copper export protein
MDFRLVYQAIAGAQAASAPRMFVPRAGPLTKKPLLAIDGSAYWQACSERRYGMQRLFLFVALVAALASVVVTSALADSPGTKVSRPKAA